MNKLLTLMMIANKIICCMNTAHVKMFPREIDTSIADRFADCILEISRRYFELDLPVAVQTSSMYRNQFQTGIYDNQLLRTLVKENQFSQVTLGFIEDMEDKMAYSYNTGNKMKYGSYILVVSGKSIKEAYDLSSMMVDRILVGRNSKAKLIIIFTGTSLTFHQQKRLAKKLLQDTLTAGFVNFIVIVPTAIQGGNLQQLNIFGWDPNSQSDICSNKLDTIEQLDTWISDKRAFLLNADLFPQRTFIDMKGCKFYIVINMHYPFIYIFRQRNRVIMSGSFYNVIFILNDLLNCSIRIGSYDPKSYRIAHAEFPVFLHTQLQNDDCTIIYPYFVEDYYWYVPSPLEIPRWKSLIRAFEPEMWTLVSLAFIFGSLTLYCIQKFMHLSHSKNDNSISLTNQFLSSMKTYLGLSTIAKFRGKTAILTFILWLFYCMVVNIAYQSALFGLIVNPGHYPAIITLNELDESGLEKVKSYYAQDVLAEGLHSINLNDLPLCANDNYVCFKKISENRKQAVLVSKYVGDKAVKEFSKDGVPKVIPVEERYFTSHWTVEINKFACILHRPVERVLRQLTSAGLIQKWNLQYDIQENRRIAANNRIASSSSLSLNHLYGVFYICILGFMVAVVVFIIEILTPGFQQVIP
ncbi:Ionotropic receptor 525 [Blattella germanica]|nr:Ionotropic receptor 525 [Blattella germanica]